MKTRRDPLIYGLFDPRTGELKYVGKAANGLVRCFSHLCPSSLRDRTKKNGWLKSLLKKGLRPEWDVIERAPLESLSEREQFWIAYFKFIGCDLLNMTPGGDGHHGRIWTPELRAKMSAATRGRPMPKQSPETIAKRAASLRGRKRSLEAIAKTAAATRGVPKKPHQVEAMRKGMVAFWAKPGSDVRMARAHGGRPFLDSLGRRWETIQGAARQLGISAGHICGVLKGNRKSAGGLTFAYAEGC
jgi:hypothetical protein